MMLFWLFQMVVPSVFAVLVFLGILGNLLVIYVIMSRVELWTVTNIILMNLAVADVCFLFILWRLHSHPLRAAGMATR